MGLGAIFVNSIIVKEQDAYVFTQESLPRDLFPPGTDFGTDLTYFFFCHSIFVFCAKYTHKAVGKSMIHNWEVDRRQLQC